MIDDALGPESEFDTIRRLVARWGPAASGIGDDAAVLSAVRGNAFVVSVDAAIEGRHFKAEWLTAREIGYRAVAAALSDLAAMAASPAGVLVAFGVPARWRDRLMDVADGVGDAVVQSGTVVVGGNLSAASEFSITATVLGTVFSPLSRAGARAGDRVYVTGRLGGPRMAIASLEGGVASPPFRDRFAHPVPRLIEGRWLAERGATSAIDVSDGLIADVRHIAVASAVSVEFDAAAIPRVAGASVADALQSGEEYELVVTASDALDIGEFERRFALELTEIGRVTTASGADVVVPGVEVAALHGHDHFTR